MKIKEILEKHKKWLLGEGGGERADLCDADLCSADLRRADLRGADLRDADLRDADLRDADLRRAVLRGADLREANLRGADLCDANLCDANLRGANLYGADLRGADLCDANLCDANLRGANLYGAKNTDRVIWNIYTAFYPLQCPEKGAYTAFKKARDLIVELEIPADAMRSSATSRKCRASKARVISITDVRGKPAGDSVASDYDSNFVYRVGEMVEVPDFDTDRWNECAPGIHHFITRAEALRYG